MKQLDSFIVIIYYEHKWVFNQTFERIHWSLAHKIVGKIEHFLSTLPQKQYNNLCRVQPNMSLILVYDVETTGLLPKVGSPEPNPHVIQLSFILYNVDKQNIVESHNYYIRVGPSVIITPKITELTGISREMCDTKGIPIEEALIHFARLYQLAYIIVAHNRQFDSQMLKIEMERHRDHPLIRNMVLFDPVADKITSTLHVCTMMSSVKLCNIMVEKPGQKPYAKWPTLLELHRHLFGTTPANLHNAIVDVLVCLRCFVNMYYKIIISEDEFSLMIDMVSITDD